MKNLKLKLKFKIMKNEDYKSMLIKRSYRFSIDTIEFIDMLPRKSLSSEVIAKQLIRSATSIGANIIEAQASSSKKDFINFLHHALKSANETRYWLGLIRDLRKYDDDKIQKLLEEAKQLSNMLGSSILSLKGKK
jgi:four helix bundle protein